MKGQQKSNEMKLAHVKLQTCLHDMAAFDGDQTKHQEQNILGNVYVERPLSLASYPSPQKVFPQPNMSLERFPPYLKVQNMHP